ncbi:MAG: tetratricopeptide repeat protein [Planctomycetota bacterium]
MRALIEGEGHRRAGRPHAAVESFQRAVQLAPRSALTIVLLGRAMREAGNAQSRETDLRAAIASQPHSAALERELADTLYRQEKYDEADAHYQAALAIDDQQAMLHFERARSRFFARGAAAGLTVVRAAQQQLGERADDALLSYAELLNRQKECATARDILLELLPRHRRSARVHHGIGVSFDSQEQIAEARDWYERALALDPDHRMTLLYLSHLHAGANRKTCTHCEQFFRDHPEYYDPERVETYLTRLVAAERGAMLNHLLFAVDLCKRVGRTDALRRLLRDLLQQPEAREQHDNVARALEKLDRG